jgi:chromosome segregation ATPase
VRSSQKIPEKIWLKDSPLSTLDSSTSNSFFMSDYEYESDDTFVVVDSTEEREPSVLFDEVIDPPSEENPADDDESEFDDTPAMFEAEKDLFERRVKHTVSSPQCLKRRRTDDHSCCITTSEIDLLHSRITYMYERLQEVEKKVTQDDCSNDLSLKVEALKADLDVVCRAFPSQYALRQDVTHRFQKLDGKMSRMKELEEKLLTENSRLRQMNEELKDTIQLEKFRNRDFGIKIDELSGTNAKFEKHILYLNNQIATLPYWTENRINELKRDTTKSIIDLTAKFTELEKKVPQEAPTGTQVTLESLKVDLDNFRQISDAQLRLYQKHVAEGFQLERNRNGKTIGDLEGEIQALRTTIEALNRVLQEEKRRSNTLSGSLDQLDRQSRGLEREVDQLLTRTEDVKAWPEKVNLLTCTTNAALDLVGDLSSKFKDFEKIAWEPKLEEINKKLQASIDEHRDTDERIAILEENLETLCPKPTSDNDQKMEENHDDNILGRVEVLENSVAELRELPTLVDVLNDQVEVHLDRLNELRDYQLETVRACKPIIAKTEELANQTAALEQVTEVQLEELRAETEHLARRLKDLRTEGDDFAQQLEGLRAEDDNFARQLDELRDEDQELQDALAQLRQDISTRWTLFTKNVRDSLMETQNYTQTWIGQIHKEMHRYKGNMMHYFNVAEEREFKNAAREGERMLMEDLEDKAEGVRRGMQRGPRK